MAECVHVRLASAERDRLLVEEELAALRKFGVRVSFDRCCGDNSNVNSSAGAVVSNVRVGRPCTRDTHTSAALYA
jgi:recombinational DNA repair protein (RecF pathway)